MTENVDKVAAVIPVRNGTNYIIEAIRSCLEQTYPVQEIIVVDDGSTDGTVETIRAAHLPTVRVIEQPWKGTSAALNNGILATDSRVSILSFLDHDDIWMPNKTNLQIDALSRDPSLDAVFGHVSQFVSPELLDAESQRIGSVLDPQPGPCMSTMMIRRSALQKFGDFPEQRDALAFVPWYFRAQQAGIAVAMLDATVARRRIHLENSTKKDRGLYQEAYLELARAAVKNRRERR